MPSRNTYTKQPPTNSAFIDSQNVNLGIQSLGWKLGWRRFRVYLPVLAAKSVHAKGNVDADLVLKAMTEITRFDRAVIITSDGDFYSLVEYLYQTGKLEVVLSTSPGKTSALLKKSAKERMQFLDVLRAKLEYKQRK